MPKLSKARKALFEAPLHRRHKIMSVHLSRELREKYGCRSLPVRVGDTVLVMRGDFKGVEGKVIRVDRKKFKVYIDAVVRKRSDGTDVHVPIHYSNLVITKLDLSDDWRKKVLDRRAKAKEAE